MSDDLASSAEGAPLPYLPSPARFSALFSSHHAFVQHLGPWFSMTLRLGWQETVLLVELGQAGDPCKRKAIKKLKSAQTLLSSGKRENK